ncbi:MAG: AMIN domain-containing protein, partial [Proteobacteria bacterium]|nr:AMIN domain-containing protein [Pseudomonadota bacterium]
MKHKINFLLLLIEALIVIVIFSPQSGFCSPQEPLLKTPPDKPGVQKKISTTQGTSPVRIDKIEVSDTKNACRVTITAAKIPTYTVFKLSKPDRIIVDMPDLMVDQKSSLPVQLQNNIISGIKVNTIDKNGKSTAHLEILLKQALSYDTSQRETSLFIDIAKPQLAVEQKSPASQEPKTQKKPILKPQPSAASNPTKESAAEKEIPKKLSIKNIDITDTPNGYQVTIAADAEIKNYHPFTLQKPTRLAIDFPSATCSVSRPLQNIKNSLVRAVRISSADDKVRFVMDFATSALPRFQIAKKGTDLMIMIDAPRKAAVREAVVESSAPVKKTAISATPTKQKDPAATEKMAPKKACSTKVEKSVGSTAQQSVQRKRPEAEQPAAPDTPPLATAGAPGEAPQSSGQKIS